jgi:hypothetical protein
MRSVPFEGRFRRAQDFIAQTNALTGRIAVAVLADRDAGRVGRELQDLVSGEAQTGFRCREFASVAVDLDPVFAPSSGAFPKPTALGFALRPTHRW